MDYNDILYDRNPAMYGVDDVTREQRYSTLLFIEVLRYANDQVELKSRRMSDRARPGSQ
jgi:hypothetical protein